MAPRTHASPPPDSAPSDRRQRVQSAQTGLAILKALTRLGGASSLTAIAAEAGENSAKVHRYLSSFCEEGFVAQDPATLHYHLSTESIRLGQSALRQCDPVRLGAGALHTLRDQLQVTSFIAVMGNLGPTVLRMEEPLLPVTVNIRAGSVLPLLWSATGQAFLAFGQGPDWQQRALQELPGRTPQQQAWLPHAQAVPTMLQQVRQQGCAVVQGVLLAGISAVAAPIFDAQGQVAAVLTALGASQGLDTQLQGAVCTTVIAQAQHISTHMGYLPSAAPHTVEA